MANRRVTIQEAAKMSERSLSTVRRWVKTGVLKDYRRKGDTRSPVLIDYSELMAVLSHTSPKPPTSSEPMPTLHDDSLIAALNSQIEELRRDKADLRIRLDRAEQDARDLREKVAVLEKELNGGFRGMLRAAMRSR